MSRVSRPAALPAVGTLLNQPPYAALRERYTHALVVEAIRDQLAFERSTTPLLEAERVAAVDARLRGWLQPGLRRVINATGVVLHTNLGRAPLSRTAAAAVAGISAGYSNLELDLTTGRRGERSTAVEKLLRRLTGAEAALAVNNNAAGVLLALTALCKGREVIVSRGEQVEIGGSFRMPEVMRLSGARMVEVGTTNRTRREDYEAAVTPRTAAVLRVHPSNYRISGFTESASLADLAALANEHGLLLLDDLGSGAIDATGEEPTVTESVRRAHVVMFSGDKLLGGPQAGIVAGRSSEIHRMRKHPLARAVRVDKMTLAALDATLRERLVDKAATLPVERMLRTPLGEIRRRAALWGVKLAERDIETTLLQAESAAGGGSLPEQGLRTVLLGIHAPASRLAAALRETDPPVIARIEADLCCIDPRTVLTGEDELLLDAIEAAVASVRAR